MRDVFATSNWSPSISTSRVGRSRLLRNTARYCSTTQPMPPRPITLMRLSSGRSAVRPAVRASSGIAVMVPPYLVLVVAAPTAAVPAVVVVAGRVGAGPALHLDLHLLQPLPRHEPAPPLVALEEVVHLQPETVAVDGQLQVEVGRLVANVADDGVDAVAVLLVGRVS